MSFDFFLEDFSEGGFSEVFVEGSEAAVVEAEDDFADCAANMAICEVASGSAVSMKRRVGRPSPSATNSSNSARCRFVRDLYRRWYCQHSARRDSAQGKVCVLGYRNIEMDEEISSVTSM